MSIEVRWRMRLDHLAAALALSSCAATPAVSPTSVPVEAAAPIKADMTPYDVTLADGSTLQAELGSVSVPENRANPESRTIEVVFLRIRGADPAAPPTVYLEGGPGIPAIAMFEHVPTWQTFLLGLQGAGDLILIDQRGIGRSTPSLACPAQDRPDDGLEGNRLYEIAESEAEACAAHLRAQGHDLSGYDTEQSADDVDAVRRALGVETVDLVGFSYGTHLTLATIRRHGAHVRRAVLMGPAGPDELRKLPAVVQAQLRRVSDLAAADPAVNAHVPDLLALMRRVFEEAEATPISVEVQDPQTGERGTIKVGRLALEIIVFADFGDTNDLPNWPRLFHGIERGDYTLLARQVEKRFLTVGPGHGMPPVMRIASGVSAQRAKLIAAQLPDCLVSGALDFPFQSEAFRNAWGVPVLPDAFRAPVESDVPLVVYTGTLDGNAPPKRGANIAKGFSDVTHVVVENAGHEDFHRADVAKQVEAFLSSGTRPAQGSIERPPLRFTPIN